MSFSKKTILIQTAIFWLVVMALELLSLWSVFFSLNAAGKGVVHFSQAHHLWVYLWPLLFQIFLSHAVLFAVIFGLGVFLKMRRFWVVLASLFLYVHVYLSLMFPYLYEEFDVYSKALQMILPHAQFSLVVVCIFLVAACLWYYSSAKKWKLLAVTGGWLFFGLAINNPFVWIPWKQKQLESEKISISTNKEFPNYIFIGIDGLRPGSLEKIAKNFPQIENFLTKAQYSGKGIAHVAKSYPSLFSILSGKPSHLSQVRANLQQTILDHTDYIEKSPLFELRKKDYQVHVGVSESIYAYFKEKPPVDEWFGSRPGVHNFIVPSFFKDKLFFGFWNNPIGIKLFPEILDQGYMGTHWPTSFAERFTQQLKVASRHSGNFFLLGHYVGVHWPGAFPYPYYRVYADGQKPPFFSYGNLNSFLMDRMSGEGRFQHFVDLYDQGVIRLAQEYLEPLLIFLEKNQFFENSIVVLFSDHGESLPTKETSLRSIRKPNHGLLISPPDDSNEGVIWIRAPQKINLPSQKEVALSETVQFLLNEKKSLPFSFSKMIPIENDYHVYPTFPYQIHFPLWAKVWLSGELSGDEVFLNRRLQPGLFYLKQRGLYETFSRQKHVLIPTIDGFSYSRSQFGETSSGTREVPFVMKEIPSIVQKWNEIYQQDIEKALSPGIHLSATENQLLLKPLFPKDLDGLFASDPQKYQWIYFHASLYEYFHDFHRTKALQQLQELILHPNTVDPIKNQAQKYLHYICKIPFRPSVRKEKDICPEETFEQEASWDPFFEFPDGQLFAEILFHRGADDKYFFDDEEVESSLYFSMIESAEKQKKIAEKQVELLREWSQPESTHHSEGMASAHQWQSLLFENKQSSLLKELALHWSHRKDTKLLMALQTSYYLLSLQNPANINASMNSFVDKIENACAKEANTECRREELLKQMKNLAVSF